MLKAIVFDFDGTLLESADIKTDAFAKLFREYPEHRDAILHYHETHAGISRYVKFRIIYRDILKKPLPLIEEQRLGDAFSELVLDKMETCPLVLGAVEFLTKVTTHSRCFIASGTPEGELREIVARRGIDKYFEGVYGSPATKPEILRCIRDRHALNPFQMLYVGDALSDLEAAQAESVPFLGRTHKGQHLLFPPESATALFLDFTDLERQWGDVLARLDLNNCADLR
jgi:phosphoglycolate phosphatase-like HAD superfamily hydrolase